MFAGRFVSMVTASECNALHTACSSGLFLCDSVCRPVATGALIGAIGPHRTFFFQALPPFLAAVLMLVVGCVEHSSTVATAMHRVLGIRHGCTVETPMVSCVGNQTRMYS